MTYPMNNLRRLREEHEVLQKDVASFLGISRAAYSNYETGMRSPDVDMLRKLADFFSVSIDELLDYTPKHTQEFSLQSAEKFLIKKYRSLSSKGQERILNQLDFELELEARDRAPQSKDDQAM